MFDVSCITREVEDKEAIRVFYNNEDRIDRNVERGRNTAFDLFPDLKSHRRAWTILNPRIQSLDLGEFPLYLNDGLHHLVFVLNIGKVNFQRPGVPRRLIFNGGKEKTQRPV